MSGYDVLICDADLGAEQPGAGLGPAAVLTAAAQRGIHLVPSTIIRGPKRHEALGRPSVELLDQIVESSERQCQAMARSLRAGQKVLALSGDHANAVGWIAGVREAFPSSRVGVIWIDAHGDLHTPGSTPSGNVHGMPLAALLGCDDSSTCQLDFRTRRAWRRWQRVGNANLWPKLSPRDLMLVEIRDLEQPEWDRIDQFGISHLLPGHRSEWGIDALVSRIWARFADYDAVFVSFDVDALDGILVPGTGTPCAGGLSVAEAQKMLAALVDLPNFVGLEIAEVNPLLDTGNQVAQHVVSLLASAWPALELPRPKRVRQRAY